MLLSAKTQLKTHPMTFERGSRAMSKRLEEGSDQAFFANTADPLHAAFEAKAVIHSGPGGDMLMGPDAQTALDALTHQPREGKTIAYVHVPFCETRCLYCMFYQNPFSEEASHAFARRLIKEIELWKDREVTRHAPVHAVYFGGGTPTALAPDDLRDVLDALHRHLPLANDCEITLEGRIHNFTDEKMQAAVDGGVNRFSLGVQTFDDHVRRSMMRVDGRDAIIRRLDKLVSFDQAAVVIDLIYGFPGQTMDIWQEDLRIAQGLALDGVDCYQLNVFEKSPLARYVANGRLPSAADTALKADMFAASVDSFTEACWRRLSNNHWGRTHRERNIYNALGKSECDCLAFGCGAGGRLAGHSFMLDRRLSDWSEGIDRGVKPVGMLTKPTPHWHLLRVLSAAMESGRINLEAIERRFALPVVSLSHPLIDQWIDAGLLERRGEWLVQTLAGQFWHVTLAQLLIRWLTPRLTAV